MTNCKTCKKRVNSGILVESQFKENPLLTFCSEKCKKQYIEKKLNRIKWKYPKFYDKIFENLEKKKQLENIDIYNYMEKYVI